MSECSTAEELRQAVITVHGGGSVITPPLASHLLKEHAVVRRVVQGISDSEIAKALSISPAPCETTSNRSARGPAGGGGKGLLTKATRPVAFAPASPSSS